VSATILEFLRYGVILAATFVLAVGAVTPAPELVPYGLLLLAVYMILSVWNNRLQEKAKTASESGTTNHQTTSDVTPSSS
jgi:hypothetical protein